MEAVALFAVAGLGYVITQLTGNKEGFQTQAQRGPDTNPLATSPQGGSAKGDAQLLDQQYSTLVNTAIPKSEPVTSSQQGLMTGASYMPPVLLAGPRVPSPEPLDSSSADVSMNPAGIEIKPNYVQGDYLVSELTGSQMKTKDFTHNNMTPFFGGRVKQNVAPATNTGILDSFTGSGINQIKKREVETMFDTARAPYGNPYGLESSADFIKSRINDPRNRGGERPFEPVRVAPGVNEGFAASGKGGFQQFEINQYMIDNIKRTDELRTADNPKLTYNQPTVPGKHFIGGAAQDSGEVRKYRPDTFFVDESGERFGAAGQSEFTKETSRPVQVLKHTARPETNTDAVGPATSQEFGESYVVGSYRLPSAQQYGGAGYRNADMTSYTSANTDAAENDYGRSGIEIRPNERNVTGERVMGLNLVPADTGNVTVHYDDPARPTRRAESEGTIRQTGTPVGYAGGAPAITVWDPNDVARTTVKEGTIFFDHMGIASSASAPNKLKVYDPDDIAKPTQKSQLSAKSDYFGSPNATMKDFTSHDSAYNMRTNPNKEQIAVGRKPLHGNGGSLAVFDGNIKQTTKRINADSVNDRSNAINRVSSIPTGVGDIGAVKYRVPLKLDVSAARNGRETLSSVYDNPLMASQNLARNAENDDAIYQDMLQAL
jgi:hypothetical protein